MKIKLVKIEKNNNISFAYADNFESIKKNTCVIVKSDKGLEFAKVVSSVFTLNEKKIIKELDKIERLVNDKDLAKNEKNINDSVKALNDAKKIAKQLDLDINVLNAYFTFDRSHLLFNFISDNRVDFRELAKKLAGIYKTRIELRQIGVRDKAKSVGGLGPCGRFLCCNLFLNDFESVSINMAKNQYISLKPDKINGIWGRWLCCLNYEDQQYSELKKDYPKINSKININGIEGKVISINVLNKKISIEKNDKTIVNIGIDEYESSKWFIRI